MNQLNRTADLSEDDALRKRLLSLGKKRVASAERVSAAIAELEGSVAALLASDRAFFEQIRTSGCSDYGRGQHLPRLLRTLLVGEMQMMAPKVTKHLNIPYVPNSAQRRVPEAVTVMVEHDLGV